MQRLLLGFLITIFSLAVKAQNSTDFFKNIPVINETTPAWAILMYSNNPFVPNVVDSYNAYYEENQFIKNIHTQNYKLWLRTVEPLLNEDGYIIIPSEKDEGFLHNELREKFQQRSTFTKVSGSVNQWVSMGPFSTYVQNTTQLSRNHKNIYSVDQSLSNPNLVICGTEAGGVYKSIDKGLNWTLITKNETFVGGNSAVKIHPTNPNIFFVASNRRIYKTINAGNSWNEMYFTDGTGNEFKFHPTNTDTIFHTSSKGLFRTYDAGVNWVQVYTEKCWDIDFHPTNPDTIYLLKSNTVAVRSELFRSDDAGNTWNLKDNGYYVPTDIANASESGGKIAISPAAPNLVYVCLIGASKANDEGWIGVFRSSNKGDNWINPSGQDGNPYGAINGIAPWSIAAYSGGYHQGFFNFDFEASAIDPGKLWIATIRLTESSDSAKTFTSIGAANSARLDGVHADVQGIEVNGTDIWVATDGGLNYSNDELQTETIMHTGIQAAHFWGFNTGWNEDTYTGGKYHDGTSGWYEGYGLGNALNIGGVEEPSGYVHPIESRKLLYRTHYNSANTSVKTIPKVLGDPVINHTSFPLRANESYSTAQSSGVYFHPYYANHIFIGRDNKIYKSTNGGNSFDAIYSFSNASSMVYEIEISRSNPDVMYCVINPDGGYWTWNEIWKSIDGGNSWNRVDNFSGNRRGMFISLNPENENELWLSQPNGSNGSKVHKTIDGGITWTNMSTASLDNETMYDVLYQGGSNDIVYVATRNTVFYWDVTSSNWINYGTGLPMITKSLKLNPFYRDGELRLGSFGRGVWARKMVDTLFTPSALPITYADSVFCSRDTVQLDCYSVLKHQGASWNWVISPAPSYISSTTVRNPKIVFGTDGTYDVTLSITDGNGGSDSKTILNMITVESKCEPDTIPGMALNTLTDGDYFVSNNTELTNITHFTTTAWIKPNGAQQGFAGIVSNGEWCAHCTNGTLGLVMDYYGEKLYYRWSNGSSWGSNSGMTVPMNEWSYVAMVVTPDSVILYLNEDKWVSYVTLNPVDISTLYIGHGHYSNSFRGLIDEVSIWNRDLSQSEIREMRHLTKDDISDPNLVSYFQFNEIIGTSIMDKAGFMHGNLNNGATLSTSSAPIGSGESHRLDISAANSIDFSNAGAKLHFSDCTTPEGEMVISRINQSPYLPINTNSNPEKYWVINYYDGSSFPLIDSVELNTENSTFVNSLSNTSNAFLHVRDRNADDMSWQSTSKAKNQSGNTLGFGSSNQINNSLQLHITDGGTSFTEQYYKPCQADTIPGKALQVSGASNSYAKVKDDNSLNFNSNTDFTFSTWAKTSSTSGDAVIIAKKDWDSGYNPGWVVAISNGEFWVNVGDGSNRTDLRPSNLINDDKWHHIAVSFERADSAKIYLDGEFISGKSISNVGNIDNALEMVIGADSEYDYRLNADIDEICIWNRALSIEEIRMLRHLTKEDTLTDPSLVSYYQFNETNGTNVYDKTSNQNHATLSNALRVSSSAPVGGGISRKLNIISGGTYSFGNTGVEMIFPSSGTYPDGELVVSRINIEPNSLPNTNDNLKYYWIVNNYGKNASFNALDEIKFTPHQAPSNTAVSNPSTVEFYKRNDNEHLNNWIMQCSASSVTSGNNGYFSFNNTCNLTSFSQLQLTSNNGTNQLLPVELLSFEATNIENKEVLLNWITATEVNLDYYEIYHSKDGIHFELVGTESPENSNSNSVNTYKHFHKTPQIGYNYYKLKIIDLDNSFEFSNVKAIKITKKNSLELFIYPNPISNKEELNINISNDPSGRIYFYNSSGKLVKDVILKNSITPMSLKIFSKGVYHYSLITESKIRNGKLLVK